MTFERYASYLAVLSVVTFVIYVADKAAAIRHSWRIPEKILLLLSFIGGAVGGSLAMHLVRHKTRKIRFHFINLIGLAWQIALLIYLIDNPITLF